MNSLRHHRAHTIYRGTEEISGVLDSGEDGVYLNISDVVAALRQGSASPSLVERIAVFIERMGENPASDWAHAIRREFALPETPADVLRREQAFAEGHHVGWKEGYEAGYHAVSRTPAQEPKP